MKKFTEDQIRKTVWDMAEKMSKHTAEILLENMENCTKKLGLKDENLEGYINNTMIPISTAYQIGLYTMENVLCELLCGNDDESAECK